MSRRWMVPLVAVMVLLATGAVASACPGCKEALAANDGSAQGDMASGYFWSILFMMSMPFAIVGAFTGVVYRSVRRAQKLEEANSSVPAEEVTL